MDEQNFNKVGLHCNTHVYMYEFQIKDSQKFPNVIKYSSLYQFHNIKRVSIG